MSLKHFFVRKQALLLGCELTVYRYGYIPSLQRNCLQRIARDMKWWCENNALGTGRYKYVLGPFDDLNSTLIQELISILAKSKALKASYFNILLHSNLKLLDLSLCSHLANDQLLKMITTRCKKLTHLCLKNCSRISLKVLRDLPRNLPNLQYIDFSCSTNCSSEILEEIAKFCPKLQVLRVDSCHQVDDVGILALCCKENQDQNGCSAILELNLSSTSVTETSVKTILQNQPHIRILSLASLQCEQQLLFNETCIESTKLSHLDVSHNNITDSSVQNICRLFPFLVELSINCCPQLSRKSMEAISTLKHLQCFSMAQYGLESQLNFLSDVVPFLQKCGLRLKTLNLSNLRGVDTSFLAFHCPELSKLSLADCVDITGRHLKSKSHEGSLATLTQACSNLQYLDLQNGQFSSTFSTAEHLAAIIGASSKLKELNLARIEGLTDECFEQSLLSSEHSSLASLDLSYCADFSTECAESILHSCSSLSSLNLSHCRLITLQNAESLRRQSKENGRAVKIIWA